MNKKTSKGYEFSCGSELKNKPGRKHTHSSFIKEAFKKMFKIFLESTSGKALFSENIGRGEITLPRKKSVTDYKLRENP